MSPAQRLVWAGAAIIVVVATIGFLTIPAQMAVPRQFDLNGWSSFSSRNVSLGLFIGGALLAASILHALLDRISFGWIPPFAVGAMALLTGTVIAAILWAS